MKIKSYYEKTGKERPKRKRGGTKKIEIPILEIVKDFESGLTPKELAIKYGFSPSTINKRINEYYKNEGKERSKNIKHKNPRRIELPREEIIYDYEKGTDVKFLANKYGISFSLMYSRIAEYKQQRGDYIKKKRKPHNAPTKKIILPIEEIIDKHRNGFRIPDLAKEYKISTSHLYLRIKEYYQEKNQTDSDDVKVQINALVQEYVEKGLTPEQIIEIAKKKNNPRFNQAVESALKEVKGKQDKGNHDDRE